MNPKDWDELAELDPCGWITCACDKQRGNLDVSKFFETGERQIAEVLAHAKHLGYPVECSRALDFGCGVGRLTRALATHFEHVYGVDASLSMIKLAQKLNASSPSCQFLVSPETSLNMFKSDEFDMVYSWQVFQNMRNPAVVASLMRECARVLKRGGLLAFQCPIPLPRTVVSGRCKPLKAFLKSVGVKRSHIYWPLRALGVSRELLYARLKLRPEVSVIGVPQDQVTSLLNHGGAQVLEIQRGSFAGLPDVNRTYWITK